MSTVALIFDLPEEHEEFNLAYCGSDWALVSFDLSQKLRNLLKYDSKGYDEHTLEYVRDTLIEIMDSHDVSLDMIP